MELFNNCQDVGLTQDGVLFAVNLYLCAGIFAQQNLLTNSNNHLFFMAVNNTARTNSNDFCDLWFFLCSSCQNDAALGGLFSLYHFYNNTVK